MAIRILIVAFALLLAGVAFTLPVQAKSNAPLGYQLMCLKTPEQCTSSGPSKVAASGDIMATLKRLG